MRLHIPAYVAYFTTHTHCIASPLTYSLTPDKINTYVAMKRFTRTFLDTLEVTTTCDTYIPA